MIRLTRRDVLALAHQHLVFWPELKQIEQNLPLSLAMRAMFAGSSGARGWLPARSIPSPSATLRSEFTGAHFGRFAVPLTD